MNRAEALTLLHEYTQSDGLRKHAYAVEAAMRAYAGKFGEDAEHWGITGLLHDFDYEKHPDPAQHPTVGVGILRGKGAPEDMLQAILSHADHTGVPRRSRLDHALFACDELAGFITAVTLVRPSKSITDVDVAAVKKKMKDKAFARNLKREDLTGGAQGLGVDLDAHIGFVIDALRAIAPDLGLDGRRAAGPAAGTGTQPS